MKLLIDADYLVYKACAAAETEVDFGEDVIVVTSSFSDAMKNVERDIKRSRVNSSIQKQFYSSVTMKISEKI